MLSYSTSSVVAMICCEPRSGKDGNIIMSWGTNGGLQGRVQQLPDD